VNACGWEGSEAEVIRNGIVDDATRIAACPICLKEIHGSRV
jgi:hypothetical protein